MRIYEEEKEILHVIISSRQILERVKFAFAFISATQQESGFSRLWAHWGSIVIVHSLLLMTIHHKQNFRLRIVDFQKRLERSL